MPNYLYDEDDESYEQFPEHYEDDDYLIDGVGFADPGGESSLRAATEDNPRNLPCPRCGRKNVLTPIDVRRGYQCNHCAEATERGADIIWVGDREDSCGDEDDDF